MAVKLWRWLTLLILLAGCSEPLPATPPVDDLTQVPPTIAPSITRAPTITAVPPDTGWRLIAPGIEYRELRVTVEDRSDRLRLARVDPAHARLIEKNLRRSNPASEIVKLGDGQRALDYLRRDGADAKRPEASHIVVLLDLNMPGMSGYQVLQRLKADERTRSIPVVVLTTTDDSTEIRRCYELGCNMYITKPVDYERFSEAIHRLGHLLAVASMPDGQAV